MIKKRCLYFLFFCSYAIVLLHSFVPHHHHEEERRVSQHHENDHEEDNNPISLLFSHLQHQPGSKDINYPARASQESKIHQSSESVGSIICLPIKLFSLSANPPENSYPFISPLTPSRLFFRGPPILV